jgi:hypothetical protein
MDLTFEPIVIGAGAPDRHGALVLHGGELVAVVARLDDPVQEDLVGWWIIEAAFGQLADELTGAITFVDRGEAERWLSGKLAKGSGARG